MRPGSFRIRFILLFASAVILVPQISSLSVARAVEINVILVPVPRQPSWHEFALLAAVPAAAHLNAGNPAVIALDDFGAVSEEIRRYFKRYKPQKVYVLGK